MSRRQEISRDLLKLLQERSLRSLHESNALVSRLKRPLDRIRSCTRYKAMMNNRNSFVEAIERLSALTIVKDVPDFHGTFEMISKSNLGLMIVEHSYENALIPFIESILKHGDHVIDVGANIGLYANLSSKLVGQQGKVLAIEPNPFILKLLESNIRRNQLDNIILFNGVATSEPGFYKLNATEGCPEYSSLGSIVHPHAPKEVKQVTVEGETLDNLVSKHNIDPIFLKIDVEGAGGIDGYDNTMVLEKYKPYILSELDDGLLKELKWDASKVLNLLEKYNYDVFDSHNGSSLSSAHSDRPFIGEVIALPRESKT